MLQKFLPSAVADPDLEASLKAQQEKAMREHMKNIIFGGGQSMSTVMPVTVPQEPQNVRTTPFGIPGLKPLKGDA
jgi:hypothetical protein